MSHKNLVLVLILVLVVAGCAPQASATPASVTAPTKTPTAVVPAVVIPPAQSTTVTPMPTVKAKSGYGCGNPYYPVLNGATWNYQSGETQMVYNMMETERDKGTYKINIQSDKNAFTIDLKCTDKGVVIMDAPGATTTVSDENGTTTVSTYEVEGVTVPNNLKVNDKWTQMIKVMTDGKQSVINHEFAVIGFEEITVPAGKFNALKVDQTGYLEIMGQKIKFHGYQWFAEGVGTVKSSWDGAAVVELVSYKIP